LRSKFLLADIKGEIAAFRLTCVGTTHNGPVDAETQWTVLAKAGECILRIDGAPGATFRLDEEW
jgi:hypothetical protein